MEVQTARPNLRHWRDHLANLERLLSDQGVADSLERAEAIQGPKPPQSFVVQVHAFAFPVRMLSAYLLAALQEEGDSQLSAFDAIDAVAFGASFGQRPPAGLKPELRGAYPQLARTFIKMAHNAARLYRPVAECYANDDYDLTANADDHLRHAARASLAGDSNTMMRHAALAAVLQLRGQAVWRGWLDEGSQDLRDLLLGWQTAQDTIADILPLASIAEERATPGRLIDGLNPARDKAQSTAPSPVASNAKKSRGAKSAKAGKNIKRLLAYASRSSPLPDEEIVALGPQYAELCELAQDFLFGMADLPAEVRELFRTIGIHAAGTLRLGDSEVVNHLLSVISDEAAQLDSDAAGSRRLDAAVLALQRIGPPATDACLTFVKNTLNDDARWHAAMALAGCGAGDERVLAHFVEKLDAAQSTDEAVRWAGPLGTLGDARAAPHLLNALGAVCTTDSVSSSDDAASLLDALHAIGALAVIVHSAERAGEFGDAVLTDGTLANGVVPFGWVPPSERADEESLADLEEEEEDSDVLSRLFDSKPESDFEFAAPSAHKPAPVVAKTGRNDPCPCGSGKKFKYCHGKAG